MPTKLNALACVSHHPPPTDYKVLAGRKARIYQTEQEGELVFILLDKSVDKSSSIEAEATFGSHLSALESQIAELKSLLLSHNSRSLIQATTPLSRSNSWSHNEAMSYVLPFRLLLSFFHSRYLRSFKGLTFRSPSNHHSVIFSLGVLKDAIVFYLIITRRANGKMLKYYTYRRFTAI